MYNLELTFSPFNTKRHVDWLIKRVCYFSKDKQANKKELTLCYISLSLLMPFPFLYIYIVDNWLFVFPVNSTCEKSGQLKYKWATTKMLVNMQASFHSYHRKTSTLNLGIKPLHDMITFKFISVSLFFYSEVSMSYKAWCLTSSLLNSFVSLNSFCTSVSKPALLW